MSQGNPDCLEEMFLVSRPFVMSQRALNGTHSPVKSFLRPLPVDAHPSVRSHRGTDTSAKLNPPTPQTNNALHWFPVGGDKQAAKCCFVMIDFNVKFVFVFIRRFLRYGR